jgi:hypothetical protein
VKRFAVLLALLLATQANGAVPVINGSPLTSTGGTADPTTIANFSTSGAGKVLVAATVNGGNISSITSASLTFSLRATADTGGAQLEWWEADSAGAITNETISIDFAAAVSFVTAVVFGVGTVTDFDTDASLPDVGTTDADATVSTDATDTMVFGIFRGVVQNNATPATWAEVYTDNYLSVYYKTFTSVQSGLTVPKPSGETLNGRIGDAIAGTSSGGAVIPGASSYYRRLRAA